MSEPTEYEMAYFVAINKAEDDYQKAVAAALREHKRLLKQLLGELLEAKDKAMSDYIRRKKVLL